MTHRLSKSRYTSGTQCHKLPWWKVPKPLAIELQPNKVLEDRLDQGRQVGALARNRFPNGVLIDLPHHSYAERVALTRRLLDDGAPAIFEASFLTTAHSSRWTSSRHTVSRTRLAAQLASTRREHHGVPIPVSCWGRRG
jgi:hypothetical protein